MITKVSEDKIKFSYSINNLFNAVKMESSLLTVGLKDEKGEDISEEYQFNNSHKQSLFMECLNSSIGRLQPLVISLSFGIVDAFKITETEATITLKDNKSCDDNYLKMIDQNINDVIIYGCLLCLYEKKQNLNIRDITSGKFSVSYAKLNDSVFNLKKTSLNTYLSNLRW